MYRDYSNRVQSINEAIRGILNEAGKFKMYDPNTRTVIDSDAPGANRVFGEGDKAYIMSGGKKVYLNRPSYNKPLIDVPAAAPAAPAAPTPTTSGRQTGIGPGKTAVQSGKTWDEVTLEMYPKLAGAKLERVNGKVFANGVEIPGASYKTSHYAKDAPTRAGMTPQPAPPAPPAPPVNPKDPRPQAEQQPAGFGVIPSDEAEGLDQPSHRLPTDATTGEVNEPARVARIRSDALLFPNTPWAWGRSPNPSFTTTGAASAPGRRADGTQVDIGVDAQGNPISAGRQQSQANQINPVPGFISTYISNFSDMYGPSTNYNKLARTQPVVPQGGTQPPLEPTKKAKSYSGAGLEPVYNMESVNAYDNFLGEVMALVEQTRKKAPDNDAKAKAAREKGVQAAKDYLAKHPRKKGARSETLRMPPRT